MGPNEREMERFAQAVRKFPVAGARRTIRLIHRGTVRRFGVSPGTPKDTGEARSGGRVGLNSAPAFVPPPDALFYPIMGASEVDAATQGMKLGDSIIWINRVPYALILEGGRRFSSNAGHDIGSLQAPKGFLNLSIENARELMREWRFTP